VQRGDDQDKRLILAPPYVTIGNHRIPLDVLSFFFGLVLILFNQQIALWVQVRASDLMTFGQILLALGAVFFIFWRIKLK
jgi:hypothetical protein